MTATIRVGTILIGISFFFILPNAAQSAENGKTVAAREKIRVVILVGGHGFDQASFDKFWSGYDDIDSRIWKGGPYTAFDDISQFKEDVIVMYNLSSGMTEKQKQKVAIMMTHIKVLTTA